MAVLTYITRVHLPKRSHLHIRFCSSGSSSPRQACPMRLVAVIPYLHVPKWKVAGPNKEPMPSEAGNQYGRLS